MIVAVDIGNSNVVVGIYYDEKWQHFWRMPTQKNDDRPVYYQVEIRNLLLEHQIDVGLVEGVVLSTVVPDLKETMRDVLASVFNKEVVVIGPELYEALGYDVPRPYEIGTDLVSNAYSAFDRLGGPCIVVDFGTALTFTTVNEKGYILGVAIAPGIKTAMKALANQTAQLPEIPLELPDSVIGLHTTHAMQAGILWGYVGMAKELISKIRAEVGEDYKAVATGGLSFIMKPLGDIFEFIDPELTINGLRLMLINYNKEMSS